MTVGVAAWRELETQRRQVRLRHIGLGGLLFRVYAGVILGGALVLLFGGWFAGPPLQPADVADITRLGPAALGMVGVAAAFAGTRNGRSGGPLTIDPATVRHVLLSPVSRAAVLRRAAVVEGGRAVAAGAVIGVAAGALASHRLAGSALTWMLAGSAYGVLVGVVWFGAALWSSGRRPFIAVVLIALGFAVWVAVDAVSGAAASPMSSVGAVALSPLRAISLAEAAGAVVAGLFAAAGVAVGTWSAARRMSIERMERRSHLVSLIRFSVAMRDLRAVILFRRRLVQERRRTQPWIAISVDGRLPIWRRDWMGAMRWPATRWLGVAAYGGGAVFATAAAVGSPGVLAVVAAAMQFAAATEAMEALAEDADHPTLRRSLPHSDRSLWLRHLAAASTIVAGANLLGLAILVPVAGVRVLGALPVLVPAAVVACAQAGWVAVREPLSPDDLLLDDLGLLQARFVFGPVFFGGMAPIVVVAFAQNGGTEQLAWLLVTLATTAGAAIAVGRLVFSEASGRALIGRLLIRGMRVR